MKADQSEFCDCSALLMVDFEAVHVVHSGIVPAASNSDWVDGPTGQDSGQGARVHSTLGGTCVASGVQRLDDGR